MICPSLSKDAAGAWICGTPGRYCNKYLDSEIFCPLIQYKKPAQTIPALPGKNRNNHVPPARHQRSKNPMVPTKDRRVCVDERRTAEVIPVTIWTCHICDHPCILERNTVFPPERCIYNDFPNAKRAVWKKSAKMCHSREYLNQALNEGDGVYRP